MIRFHTSRCADWVSPHSASADGPAALSAGSVRRGARGFTLIELMVTLAVAGVLMMIAIPSFKKITLSNRLTTAANDLVDSLNTARMEAIKRNDYAQFCSNVAANNGGDTLGLACGSEAGAVYLLETSTTTFKAHAGSTNLVMPLQLVSPINAVRFDGQGIGHQVIGGTGVMSNTVADICTSELSSDNHRKIIITTGTIVTTTTSSGTCP
jgi:type IV fimbrial biogenesis protein FimT